MASSQQQLESAVERLWQEIEAREDELIGIVADLVRRPSLLGQEAEVQSYVADHLRTSDLEVSVWDLPEETLSEANAGDSGVPFSGRPNVTGRLKGAGSGRSLIINGHVDVVSPEPLADWSYDPWVPTIVRDRMYGRGAFDMKSGDAINLFLPRVLRDVGVELQGDLTIHSVIEEECTGNGALAASLVDRADAAVVTEPTGGSFTYAHVGVLWFRIRVSGMSWHAMQAWRGVNAITKSIPIMQALQRLDERLNETVHPAFAGIEHPINLNIGVIQGGDWPSSVPGECELHCRVSCYPGQTVAETRAAIEAAIEEAIAPDPWFVDHPLALSWDGFQSAGSVVSLEEPSVAMLGAWHERVFGAAMAPRAGTGINDMRYYNFASVPTGCYGPAGANAHAADEWLDLASMVPTTKVLGAFVLNWCGINS